MSRLALTSCFLAAGCLRTALPTPSLPPEIDRLAEVTPRRISISIEAPDHEETVGRQFLLGVIPFGTVSVASPKRFLSAIVGYEVLVRGYRPVVPLAGETPNLVIRHLDTTVMGYDLILTRRPSASVELEGTLNGRSVRFAVSEGADSSLSRFAFQNELSAALNVAAQNAVRKLFDELGLT